MPLNFTGNSRVVFTVKDYDPYLAFYKDILDLSIVNQWNRSVDDKGVVYSLGQIELELLKGNTTPSLDEGTYLYAQVKDVDALYQRLKDKAKVVTPITTQTWGHKNFMIKDPADIRLKFFSLIE